MDPLILSHQPRKRYVSTFGAILLSIVLLAMGAMILQNAFAVWPRTEVVDPDVSLHAVLPDSLAFGSADQMREGLEQARAELEAALQDSLRARQMASPVRYRLLWWSEKQPRRMPWDARLFAIAMLFGALGSWVHAAASFGRFAGNRQLVSSWAPWYVLRPFLGAALALIFYAVIRAGFLSSTGTPLENFGHYGIAAFSALVGLFTQQATKKLGDVFNALFTPRQEDRDADALPTGAGVGGAGRPEITSVRPQWIKAGAKPVSIRVVGSGFGEGAVVKVDGEEIPCDREGDEALRFDLPPRFQTGKRALEVTVETPRGASAPRTLVVTP